jgi:CheY-like chemotaxis protein
LTILPQNKIAITTNSFEAAPLPEKPKPEKVVMAAHGGLLPSGQKRLSMLLVEDNPINLKLLVASFKKMGHSYETATDGSEAVSAYRRAERKFDIVFMDIQMPVMDGMEASVLIRKFEKQNDLPSTIIIALTALTSLQAEQEAMDSGADRFMSKPVSMKKLRDVVEEYFHEGKASE